MISPRICTNYHEVNGGVAHFVHRIKEQGLRFGNNGK